MVRLERVQVDLEVSPKTYPLLQVSQAPAFDCNRQLATSYLVQVLLDKKKVAAHSEQVVALE